MSESVDRRVILQLDNPSRSVNPTLDLPTSLSLDDFPQGILRVTAFSNGQSRLLFEGITDRLTTVPEPDGLSLFGFAAAGLAAECYRRRRFGSPRG